MNTTRDRRREMHMKKKRVRLYSGRKKKNRITAVERSKERK